MQHAGLMQLSLSFFTVHAAHHMCYLCSSCGLRIKSAVMWTFAMAVVLGLAIGCAYGE